MKVAARLVAAAAVGHVAPAAPAVPGLVLKQPVARRAEAQALVIAGGDQVRSIQKHRCEADGGMGGFLAAPAQCCGVDAALRGRLGDPVVKARDYCARRRRAVRQRAQCRVQQFAQFDRDGQVAGLKARGKVSLMCVPLKSVISVPSMLAVRSM